MKILITNDRRNWTEHIARNIGAKEARGEYLLFLDIDYIVTQEAIDAALDFTGERMNFRRRFGILDWDGRLQYQKKTLATWGLKSRWIRKKFAPGHRSQFLIKRDLFCKLGGYNEALDGKWRRTGGAGEKFWRKWKQLEKENKVKTSKITPTIFMFPNGKFCDFELPLFHKLDHQ